jgi:hypothetical protein
MRTSVARIALLVVLTGLAREPRLDAEAPVATAEVPVDRKPHALGYAEHPEGGLSWPAAGALKRLRLKMNGNGTEITNSQIVDRDPTDDKIMAWEAEDTRHCVPVHIWRTSNSIPPRTQFHVLFQGDYCGAGGAPEKWKAGVILADIDADANNDSKAANRPPAASGDAEADAEEAAEQAVAGAPGLLVPVNQCFEEGGRADRLEDNEKRGVGHPDPDWLEGLVTLKMPDEVDGQAGLDYDEARLRVYIRRGGATALIPPRRFFGVNRKGQPAFVAGTAANPDGAFSAFGEMNPLVLEGMSASRQLAKDRVTVTLRPSKGTESRDFLAYTVLRVNAAREKCSPDTAIKTSRIVHVTDAIRKDAARPDGQIDKSRIVPALRKNVPGDGWHVLVEDISSSARAVSVTVQSLKKDGVTPVDSLDGLQVGKCPGPPPGHFCSERLWLVFNATDPALSLDDDARTLRAEPDGVIRVLYKPRPEVTCRKELAATGAGPEDVKLEIVSLHRGSEDRPNREAETRFLYSYNERNTSTCRVWARCRMTPALTKDDAQARFGQGRVRLEADPVDGSDADDDYAFSGSERVEMRWRRPLGGTNHSKGEIAFAEGDYDERTGEFLAWVVYWRTPKDNSDFGEKTVRLLREGSLVDSRRFEVYYPKTIVSHHVAEDATDDNTPGSANWYYYWSQERKGQGGGTCQYRYGGASPRVTHSDAEVSSGRYIPGDGGKIILYNGIAKQTRGQDASSAFNGGRPMIARGTNVAVVAKWKCRTAAEYTNIAYTHELTHHNCFISAVGPRDKDGDRVPDEWEEAVGLNYNEGTAEERADTFGGQFTGSASPDNRTLRDLEYYAWINACFQPSYQGELSLKIPGGIYVSADPARYRGVIPEQARNEEDWTEGGYNWTR